MSKDEFQHWMAFYAEWQGQVSRHLLEDLVRLGRESPMFRASLVYKSSYENLVRFSQANIEMLAYVQGESPVIQTTNDSKTQP
jgi:hypothetical protein